MRFSGPDVAAGSIENTSEAATAASRLMAALAISPMTSAPLHPAAAQGQSPSPVAVSPQAEGLARKQVVVGMTMAELIEAAGEIYVASAELKSLWNYQYLFHVINMKKLYERPGDESKIWLRFRNATQFPGEGLTDFTVNFHRGEVVSIKKSPDLVSGSTESKACPGQDFDTFFRHFSESEKVQQKYTHFPFKHHFSIDTGSEEEGFQRAINVKSQREWRQLFRGPIFPNWNRRIQFGLTTLVMNYEQVNYFPDSDAGRRKLLLKQSRIAKQKAYFVRLTGQFSLDFRFQYRNGCWWVVSRSESVDRGRGPGEGED